MERERIIALGGTIAIERRHLTAAEMAERNEILGRLEMMPPASQVQDFVPGWPAPGKAYQSRRAEMKSRLEELTALAIARAE